MELPRFAQPQAIEGLEREDFDAPELALHWNYLRNPVEANYSLSERTGSLRLSGSEWTLSDAGSVTFVGRRQQHTDCRIAASFDFEPKEGDEAGLTALMCFDYHYDVGITCRQGRKVLCVRRNVGSLCVVDVEVELETGPVVLEIRADAQHYHLGYQREGVFESLVCGEVRFLTAMLAQTFTGVYFGMYATGNGSASRAAAYIDWFEYEPMKG
jgi:alpha-N-arabinofuranosidase